MRLLMSVALAALLAAAPVLVGAAEAVSRRWPERDLVGRPYDLVADVIVPSALLPALLLALVGFLTVFLAGTRHVAEGGVLRRTVAIAALAIAAVAALWVGVAWAHFSVVASNHGAWGGILFPVWSLGARELVVGFVCTAATLLAAFYSVRRPAPRSAGDRATQPAHAADGLSSFVPK